MGRTWGSALSCYYYRESQFDSSVGFWQCRFCFWISKVTDAKRPKNKFNNSTTYCPHISDLLSMCWEGPMSEMVLCLHRWWPCEILCSQPLRFKSQICFTRNCSPCKSLVQTESSCLLTVLKWPDVAVAVSLSGGSVEWDASPVLIIQTVPMLPVQ